jgi:hypothetical protein
MDTKTIPCLFVYADGHRCSGEIYRACAYGPSRGKDFVNRDDVRKYRMWCSEKGDHAGAISDSVSKQRMEFYPDEIPDDIYQDVIAMCENLQPAATTVTW